MYAPDPPHAWRLDRFYDVPPIVAHLIGGPAGGGEITLPDDRDTWRVAVAPDLARGLLDVDLLDMTTADIAVYHRIGIRDDGVRLFRYLPRKDSITVRFDREWRP